MQLAVNNYLSAMNHKVFNRIKEGLLLNQYKQALKK